MILGSFIIGLIPAELIYITWGFGYDLDSGALYRSTGETVSAAQIVGRFRINVLFHDCDYE
jgi:hypothetical protein